MPSMNPLDFSSLSTSLECWTDQTQVGTGALSSVAWTTGAQLMIFSSGVVWQSMDLQMSRNTLYLLSPRLCFFIVLNSDLYVYRDDSFTTICCGSL